MTAEMTDLDVDEVLELLTLEDKAALTVGTGAWSVAPVTRLGVPGLTLADGPHGVRKMAYPRSSVASGESVVSLADSSPICVFCRANIWATAARIRAVACSSPAACASMVAVGL